MPEPADNTNGPTPNAMPGAGAGAPNANPAGGGDGAPGEGEPELTYEELVAERDKWQKQARTNENRAKSNADKAKEYDANYATYKAAWEALQAEQNKQKTPEQLKAEADAAAAETIRQAQEAAAEAQANLLRYQVANGKVPNWCMPLITGTSETEITDQVTAITSELTAYVAAAVGDQNPRRPAPNPLVGGGAPPVDGSPQAQFADFFASKVFNT